MNSHAILGEYIRKFTVVASFLEGKGHISKGECEAKFLSGLHPTFKAQLMNRLTLAYLEHHPDDLWPTERVTPHASFLLSGSSTRPSLGPSASPESHTSKMPKPVTVKKEYYNAGSTYVPLHSDMAQAASPVVAGSSRGTYSTFRDGPFCFFAVLLMDTGWTNVLSARSMFKQESASA